MVGGVTVPTRPSGPGSYVAGATEADGVVTSRADRCVYLEP